MPLVRVSRKPTEGPNISVADPDGIVIVFPDIPSATDYLGLDELSLDIRFIPDINEEGLEVFEYELVSPPSAMGVDTVEVPEIPAVTIDTTEAA